MPRSQRSRGFAACACRMRRSATCVEDGENFLVERKVSTAHKCVPCTRCASGGHDRRGTVCASQSVVLLRLGSLMCGALFVDFSGDVRLLRCVHTNDLYSGLGCPRRTFGDFTYEFELERLVSRKREVLVGKDQLAAYCHPTPLDTAKVLETEISPPL